MPRRAASLTSRVLTPVIGIIAVSAAGLAWYLSHNTRLQTLDAATASAVATIEQFKALRGYYTSEIVAKVKKSSAMKVAVDHAGADAIPLPATMIHDLSARLSKSVGGPSAMSSTGCSRRPPTRRARPTSCRAARRDWPTAPVRRLRHSSRPPRRSRRSTR